MFSQKFLIQMADTYGLTLEQRKVFLQRMLENKAHNEIAEDLNISQAACLRRMADVYKKFQIGGKGKGKDNELRNFLIEKQENLNLMASADLTEQMKKLNNRVSVIEEKTLITSETNIENYFPSNTKCDPIISRQNLPPQSNKFIGRKEDLSCLLKYLSEDHATNVITVDGIGGVGKTSLVLEAAYRCLEAKHQKNSSETPKFDVIIFVSAKDSYLTPNGIIKRLESQQYLNDIYNAIAFTLDIPSILRTSGKERYQIVRQNLRKQKTLLIVDNFETIVEEEKEKVLGFLYDLPATVKSVITTREQRVIYASIRLKELSKEDSLDLIKQQIEQKNIKLYENEVNQLYSASGGIPLIIVYYIGHIANSIPLERILEDLKFKKLNSISKDLVDFLFQKSIEEIKNTPAYHLLLAMAIFYEAPLKDALISVAGLEEEIPPIINDNISLLRRLSLVRQQNGRYRMLAPTREYVLAVLNGEQNFKKQAFDRWTKWYLKFAEQYGDDDWGEWQGYFILKRAIIC